MRAALLLGMALASCTAPHDVFEGSLIGVFDLPNGDAISIYRGDCFGFVNTADVVHYANVGIVHMQQVWGDDVLVGDVDAVCSVNAMGYNGYYQEGGDIVFRSNTERVLRHEMYHLIAHRNGLHCWRTIDHPDGHNLDCSRK